MLVLAMEFSRCAAGVAVLGDRRPGRPTRWWDETLEGAPTRDAATRMGRSVSGQAAPSKRNRRYRAFGWDTVGGNSTCDGRVGLGLE